MKTGTVAYESLLEVPFKCNGQMCTHFIMDDFSCLGEVLHVATRICVMQLTKNTSDKLRKIANWKLIRNETKLKFGVGGGDCLSLLPSSAVFDTLVAKTQ